MSTKKEFDQALKDVKKLSDLSNDQLLRLYGLYKQATEGDVSGPKPGMLDLKGKAKYAAWSKEKGKSQAKAMAEYVAFVKKLGA
ncbi:MAG TPA: acyl-CoA-binding protein [bacterium]|nr:acyl-CoA-binding protein [bacterium]